MTKSTFNDLHANIRKWGYERGITVNGKLDGQYLKLMEEMGETCKAIAKKRIDDIKDGIGDTFVVLVMMADIELGFDKFYEIQYVEATPYESDAELVVDFNVLASGFLSEAKSLMLETIIHGYVSSMTSVLYKLAASHGLDFIDCIAAAWDEIKDRKGFLNSEGVFIKEADMV